MDRSFLNQEQLPEFLQTLRLFGELHGPTVSAEGVAAFAPLDHASSLRLDYRRTLIPPKKYLIPFREEILQYGAGSYRENDLQAPELVLFGLHPCDLDGIAYLDRVFLGDRPDPQYASRRPRMTLVGVSCEPVVFCFCNESPSSTACDPFLSTVPEGFQIAAWSAKGEAIAWAAQQLLVKASLGTGNRSALSSPPGSGTGSPGPAPWPIPLFKQESPNAPLQAGRHMSPLPFKGGVATYAPSPSRGGSGWGWGKIQLKIATTVIERAAGRSRFYCDSIFLTTFQKEPKDGKIV